MKVAFVLLALVVSCTFTKGGERTAEGPLDPPPGDAPIKKGLPGGGGPGPHCCHHIPGGATWRVGETSACGALLTSSNIASQCDLGCLPLKGSCP